MTDPADADHVEGDERLRALRDELAAIDEVPVDERLPRFEAANATLSAVLAELDEV